MKTNRNILRFLATVVLLAQPVVTRAQYTYTTNSDGSLNITGYTGTDTVITIPGSINGVPVSSIGAGAFRQGQDFYNVTISEGITTIGDNAFLGQ